MIHITHHMDESMAEKERDREGLERQADRERQITQEWKCAL